MTTNNHHQPPPQVSPPPRSACEDCNSGDQLILHNVIRTPKSPPQKLCTSCVLQHYHKSICAQCFDLYDASSLTPPPLAAAATATTTGNNRLLSCMRCENWSHPGCLRPHIPKTPYICPPCRLSPNYKYFDCRKRLRSDRSEDGKCSAMFDKEESKQLLGAARIAAITVAKAAATARVEAERRAKEAALARKRAREAIDHVVAVAVKVEGVKRREVSTVNVPPTTKAVNCVDSENVVGQEKASQNGAIVTVPVPVAVIMPPQSHNNNNNNSSSNDKNGVGVSVENGGGVGNAAQQSQSK